MLVQLFKWHRPGCLATKRTALIVGGLLLAASLAFAQGIEVRPNKAAVDLRAANQLGNGATAPAAAPLVPTVVVKCQLHAGSVPWISFGTTCEPNAGIANFGDPRGSLSAGGARYLQFSKSSKGSVGAWADRLANGIYFVGAHHRFRFGTVVQDGVSSTNALNSGDVPADIAVVFAFGRD